MSFKTFFFLVFVSCAYSTSILEESIGYREEEKVPSAASAACPEGWIESIEGCFYFANTATGLTWREGQEMCENLGGYLAEIKSEEQNTILVSLAKLEENLIDTQSWQIGLSDQGHEGRWIWQHSIEDVEFVNWASGQPEGIYADCACMDFENDYMWVAVRCDEPDYFGSPICMKDASEPTSTTASSTFTSTIPPTSSTPKHTTTSYFNRVELIGNGNSLYEGNVYAVNHDEFFGPVCDDGWGDAEANVVCRQLGFAQGNATTESLFGVVYTSNFAMDDIHCEGDEEHLQDCSYDSVDDCNIWEGAGVICY